MNLQQARKIAVETCYELEPHWESEESFFEWIGVKWIHPKERNVNFYKALAS